MISRASCNAGEFSLFLLIFKWQLALILITTWLRYNLVWYKVFEMNVEIAALKNQTIQSSVESESVVLFCCSTVEWNTPGACCGWPAGCSIVTSNRSTAVGFGTAILHLESSSHSTADWGGSEVQEGSSLELLLLILRTPFSSSCCIY